MGKKLYVGNLNYRTAEESLRTLFGQYGTVANVNVVVDRETGRAKGFAFVEMTEDQGAQAAIQALDGKEFEGRNLRVNEALPRPPRERSAQY